MKKAKSQPLATIILKQFAIILIDIAFLYLIQKTWELIDILEYGTIIPSAADTIAAAILYFTMAPKINRKAWKMIGEEDETT